MNHSYFKNVKNVNNRNVENVIQKLKPRNTIPVNYLTMRVDDSMLYNVYLKTLQSHMGAFGVIVPELPRVMRAVDDVLKKDRFFSLEVDNTKKSVKNLLRQDPKDHAFVTQLWQAFYRYYQVQYGDRIYNTNDMYLVKFLFIRKIQEIVA